MSASLRGFLIAPAMPAVLVVLYGIAQGGGLQSLWWLSLIMPISYITSAVLGFPIHALLLRRNKRKLWHYIVASIVASLVPIFVIFIIPLIGALGSQTTSGLEMVHFQIMGMMIVAGVLVAIVFWLVARPDKTHPIGRL